MYITNIMKSARHKSVNNACTYQRDAATLYELNAEERENKDNEVGIFKSIFLEVGQHGTAITSSTPFQKPLPELVDWWYSTCLGMGDRPITRPIEVLTLALRQRPRLRDLAAIKDRLGNTIQDSQELEFVMQMLTDYNHHCVRQENLRMLEQLERARDTSAPTTGATAVLAPMVLPPAAKRTRREGTVLVELQGQDHLKTLEGLGKLEFLLCKEAELLEMTSGDKEKLNPSSKRWYNRHVAKAVLCLHSHLSDDSQAFLQRYGHKFFTTKFKCSCPQIV
jgi:hypothetical protein